MSVAEEESAPVLAEIPEQWGIEGQALTFIVDAVDDDEPWQAYTFSLAAQPGGTIPSELAAALNSETGEFYWLATDWPAIGFLIHPL